MTISPRKAFAHMRHILEVPLADDRYWPRIPTLAADAVMLDLEDSVPEAGKASARRRCLDVLADQDALSGKEVFVRINGMVTEWAEADLQTLAQAPSRTMICLPKVESPDEILRAARILAHGGPDRRFYVMIESYRGLQALDEILAISGVVGVHFGYIDYGFDVRCKIFADAGDDFHGAAMKLPRARIAAAAATQGLFATGGSLVPRFRDLNKVETFIRHWRDDGYTACIALSPSHLGAIEQGIRPADHERQVAEDILAGRQEGSFIERRLADLIMRRVTCS